MRGEEFQRLAQRYADNIYAIAFNYFKNPYDAEDIVQEVLLKLYLEDKSFDSEEHIKYWLIRVAINQCKKISLSSWMKKNELCDRNCVRNFEAQMEQIIEIPEESRLFEAVMKLPKKYRVVIHLYYYEGYQTAEIAKLMKLNEGTVRTRLRRARKLLKEDLSDGWNEE